MQDIIIVGGGPAGLSAAIAARQRDNTVTIISNDKTRSGLYKAPVVDNYPGLPGISGAELLDKLTDHALGVGVSMITEKANAVLPIGATFHVGYGTEILTSKSVILTTGIAQTSVLPGEEELLGRGVSYCATCDGMLYKGKRVCVLSFTTEAEKEAEHLVSLGCEIIHTKTGDVKINGDKRVTSLIVDGEEIKCDAVFIFRQAIAPHLLLAGLETKEGLILAATSGETNIPGVYAAGDCVGAPFQVAKAIGQGLVAALTASEFVRK